MSSSGLELNGMVLAVLPADLYNVRLCGMDMIVKGNRSGKMRQRRIILLEGDAVKIKINEYDNTKGRIVYRYRNDDIPDDCKK